MTLKQLIAAARKVGFEPVHRAFTGKTLVWTDGLWRIEVTPNALPARSDGAFYAQVMTHGRSEDWSFAWESTVYALDADQAFAEFRRLGVLEVVPV
jgi:hypothetical protein